MKFLTKYQKYCTLLIAISGRLSCSNFISLLEWCLYNIHCEIKVSGWKSHAKVGLKRKIEQKMPFPKSIPSINHFTCNKPQNSVSKIVQALLATAHAPSMLLEDRARRTHFLTMKKTSSSISEEKDAGKSELDASKFSLKIKIPFDFKYVTFLS